MRIREMVKREITVEQDVAVCEQCGKRELFKPPEIVGDWPDGWLLVSNPDRISHANHEPLSFCGWICLSKYSFKQTAW